MPRTFIRQETQIRKSELYDDTIAPSQANYETNPVNIEDDLNSLRSQVQNLLNRNGATFPTGNWWDDLTAPSTLEPGTPRGANALNEALHLVEKKRILRCVDSLTDISVPGGQNYVVLSATQLPPNTTAAVGAVTTLGTVVAAHTGTFGSHSLDEVSGTTAISPKNLLQVVDGATRDPILDSTGKRIYGLAQTENSTDGHTITATSPNRIQISFVRVNAAGDDLEAVPAADIGGKTVNVCWVERVRLEDLNEQDFLGGASVDVPASATVTRQVSYDNQGTTPVDLTTNAILDLEGPGLIWEIRDDLEASLFRIVEGSAGGTSTVHIAPDTDTFDVDAVTNDFANGATFRSSGTRPVRVGVTDGQIDTSAGDLMVKAAGELFLDDVNQTGSTWAQDGIKLSETTQEWDDFETTFGGEVSLLNAIVQAANNGARKTKVYAVVTANVPPDTDVGGVGGGTNLDTQLPDMSQGNFLTDYDVFLNGELLRPGADATANNDYYPGTSLADGQLKFEFRLRAGGNPDVICVIPYA